MRYSTVSIWLYCIQWEKGWEYKFEIEHASVTEPSRLLPNTYFCSLENFGKTGKSIHIDTQFSTLKNKVALSYGVSVLMITVRPYLSMLFSCPIFISNHTSSRREWSSASGETRDLCFVLGENDINCFYFLQHTVIQHLSVVTSCAIRHTISCSSSYLLENLAWHHEHRRCRVDIYERKQQALARSI